MTITHLHALETMRDWTIRDMCLACKHAITLRQPESIVKELATSAATHCQECGIATGDMRLVTGRMYVVALGQERQATPKETERFRQVLGRLERHSNNLDETRYLAAVDRLIRLLVPVIHPAIHVTYSQRFRLLPADLARLVDDLGAMVLGARNGKG